MIRLDTLQQQLSQLKLAPGYLFFGEEEYQKQLVITAICRAFLGGDQLASGTEILYGSEIDGAEIVNRAQSLGMFAQRTALVVREADALSVKSRAAVAAYFDRPSPDSCLILSTLKPDAKSALVKQFDGLITVVNFKQLDDREAAGWAVREASTRGLRLAGTAAQVLVDLAGRDLGVISRELDKLATNLTGRTAVEITAATVKSLVGLNQSCTVYDLTAAIGNRDRAGALSIYQSLLGAGEDPTRILSAIGYELVKLWKVASVPGDSWSVSKRTGIYEYAVRQLQPAARKRSGNDYLRAFDQAYRAEYRIKSGRGDDAALVQHLIFQLTS